MAGWRGRAFDANLLAPEIRVVDHRLTPQQIQTQVLGQLASKARARIESLPDPTIASADSVQLLAQALSQMWDVECISAARNHCVKICLNPQSWSLIKRCCCPQVSLA